MTLITWDKMWWQNFLASKISKLISFSEDIIYIYIIYIYIYIYIVYNSTDPIQDILYNKSQIIQFHALTFL